MDCPICQHLKRQAIEIALNGEPKWHVLACKFHVTKGSLMRHRFEHMGDRHEASIASGTSIEARDAAEIHGFVTEEVLDQALSASRGASQDDCRCYWCSMSDYQRLLRAWQQANQRDKERFCADTRTMDVPF